MGCPSANHRVEEFTETTEEHFKATDKLLLQRAQLPQQSRRSN
jgi:hypothetical protein